MRDYIYIEDVDGLQDNILDEDCKIIYLKQKQKIILSISCVVNLLTQSH